MEKVKKNVAAAYKAMQLAKLEIERLGVIGKSIGIDNTEAKILSEIVKISQELCKNVQNNNPE